MDITIFLKKIMGAVYGRDVRQAIHDGIEACAVECTQTEAKFCQLKKEITVATTGLFKKIESDNLNLENETRWMVNPRTGVFGKTPIGQSYGNYQTGILEVKPGELYRISVCVKDVAQDVRNVLAFANGNVQDSIFENASLADVFLESGDTDYYAEVPVGSNLLLITTEDYSHGNIEVAKSRLE